MESEGMRPDRDALPERRKFCDAHHELEIRVGVMKTS